MPDVSGSIWILAGVLAMLFVVGILSLLLTIRSQKKQLLELKSSLGSMGADLNAICAGTVGVDRRLSRLEKQGLDLGYRQESLESRQRVEDPPYGEAIQMVQGGASSDRLVDELGLSHGEADLVVMLHSMKKAV